MSAESLVEAAWRELYLEECYCGGKKKTRESFCRFCYFELPGPMRHRLYETFTEGYAVYYDEAKDWLRDHSPRVRKALKV